MMNQLSPKRMFTKKLTAFHQTLPITTQQANSLLEKADRALQSFMAEKSNSYLMPNDLYCSSMVLNLSTK
ncbi:hypothetical protein [Acinetobacter ursingii]|uniref:hypothetical protein n=1 Tax=Acinetobacter ursingii TaxID=108980 RepID=UPI003AF4F0EF